MQPRTVLYVDDNAANLKLVEKLIARRPDLRLLTAVNGELGGKAARDSLPDVILLDINLPDMSGFEALQHLRRDPATARIPVIAVSVNDKPFNVESGLEAGFFRYVTKPIDIDELMEALQAALNLSGR